MKQEEEEKKKKASIKTVIVDEKKLIQKVQADPKEFKIEVTKFQVSDTKPVDLAKPYIENKQKEQA